MAMGWGCGGSAYCCRATLTRFRPKREKACMKGRGKGQAVEATRLGHLGCGLGQRKE